jgi:hypothetical protein
MRVLPVGPLTHYEQLLLHDIERGTNADEAVIEQGVAKIAVLIHEDNLVPGFDGRLVYITDENKGNANEERHTKSICTLEFGLEESAAERTGNHAPQPV